MYSNPLIMIVYILTEDEFAAYDVFESINSKKLTLAISDLTKNILLKKCKYEDRKNYSGAVDKITKLVKMFDDSPKQTSEFLKTYWAAKYELPRRKFYDLYKKSSYFKKQNAIKLIDDLLVYGTEYKRIINPSKCPWSNKESDKSILQTLNEISYLGLKTTYPLLLQLLVSEKKKKDQLSRIFSKVLYLSTIKIVILGERPGILETKYADFAKKIFENKLSLDELYKNLKVEVDKEFKKAKIKLREPLFNIENKQTKYLLYKIYRKNYKQSLNISQIKLEEIKKDSIEHILPKNPEKWKSSIFDDIKKNKLKSKGVTDIQQYINKYCYTLGNLILLSSVNNSKIGNGVFSEKKKKYIQYEKNNPLFKNIINLDKWDSIEIEKRTKLLINELDSIFNS